MKTQKTDEEYFENAKEKPRGRVDSFSLNDYLDINDLEKNHIRRYGDDEYYHLSDRISEQKLIEILDKLKSDILKDKKPHFKKYNYGLFFDETEYEFEVMQFETKSEYKKRIKKEKLLLEKRLLKEEKYKTYEIEFKKEKEEKMDNIFNKIKENLSKDERCILIGLLVNEMANEINE